MKITRLYCDSAGETHFEQREIHLADAGEIGMLSEKQPATGVVFRVTAPEYDYDWHCAPARQYVVMLEGAVELEASVGEKRVLEPGDILLVEDTWGKGHRSRNVEPKPRRSLFITLE
jgi:quercetin dioxygenase-like cupin family protein